MDKIPLQIVALAHNEAQPSSYLVILKEEEGTRRLPVSIGSFEAQAIAAAVEGKTNTRPLTHDLIANTLRIFSIDLEEVVITALRDNVFFAALVCRTPQGERIELDSRTSDALALAVRFACPVFTYRSILMAAGIVWDYQERQSHTTEKKQGLASFSEEELEQLLNDALALEDYQKAARIRDEINRRKSN